MKSFFIFVFNLMGYYLLIYSVVRIVATQNALGILSVRENFSHLIGMHTL